MLFLYPVLLVAGLSVLAPVIFHLIQRQQFPRRWIATVRFLPRDRRVNRFAPRLVDPLQLLLRIAVILAVTILMARPFVALGDSAPRNFAFVLDTSMSMNVAGDREGETALSEAKQWARKVVSGLHPRDMTALVVANAEVVRSVPLARERGPVLDGVSAAEASDRGSGGILPAIADACAMLKGRRERANVIFVLTDMRGHVLQLGQERSMEAIRTSLESGRIDLRFVRFGKEKAANAEIIGCRLTPQTAAVGSSVKLSPRIRNHSDQEMKVSVDLRVRGLPAGSARPLTVPPGSECVVDLVTLLKTRGSSYGTAVLGKDDLPDDNQFSVPLRPSSRSEILILTAPKATAPSSEGAGLEVDAPTVLSYALNPAFSLTGDTGTNLRPTVVRSDVIGTVPLDRYQLFILCGISSLPDRALQDIRSLLAGSREPRGLLLVPDDAMDALRFNEVFGAVGEPGGLPLTAARLGSFGPCNPPLEWALSSANSPVLSPFRGPSGLARDIRVFQRFELTPAERAEVFLEATDGSPLGVMMDYGRGSIATLAFSFDREHTNLVNTPAMLTFLWSLAGRLMGRDSVPALEETRVGRRMVVDLSEFYGIPGNVRIRRAAESAEEPLVFALEQDAAHIVPQFRRAGVYEFGHEKRYQDRNRFIAVNGPPGEGSLSRVSEQQARETFGSLGISIRLPESGAEDVPSGTELWPWVLALLIALYGAEGVAGLILSLRKQEAART